MATYQPTSQQLRELVLDYLLHNSYVDTAQVFAKESAALINPGSTVTRPSSNELADDGTVDMDTEDEDEDEGDEDEDEDGMDTDEDGITTDVSIHSHDSSSQRRTTVVQDIPKHILAQAYMRREIKYHILCGRVQTATDLLNTHFPAVLHLPDPETTAGSFAGTGTGAGTGGNSAYVSRKPRANPSPVDALSYSTRPTSMSPSQASLTSSSMALDARAARTRPVGTTPSSTTAVPNPTRTTTGLGATTGNEGPPVGSPHARVGYASTVSTKPVHVALNLQVQAFIEAARTVKLPFPPPSRSDEAVPRKGVLNAASGSGSGPGAGGGSTSSVSGSTSVPGAASGSAAASTPVGSSASMSSSIAGPASSSSSSTATTVINDAFSAHQTELLHRAQRLYAAVESLRDLRDRDVYREELKQVGGLLAYPEPERSPMARYLRQDHRESVADQVNSAILYHLGMPATSYIDLFVRQTAAVWSAMLDSDVELPPPSQHPVKLPFVGGTASEEKPASTLGVAKPDKDKPRIECRIPLFDLKQFLDAR